MKQYRLLKPLPGCPIGRIFKEDVDGEYYHSMSDDEAISGKYLMYVFTKKEVETNSDFFEEFNGDNYMVRIYNASNFDEFKEVDTGIPTQLVDEIQNALDRLSGKLSSTPSLFISKTYDIKWGIVEINKNISELRYNVTISKL
jgi:hypothetical protein